MDFFAENSNQKTESLHIFSYYAQLTLHKDLAIQIEKYYMEHWSVVNLTETDSIIFIYITYFRAYQDIAINIYTILRWVATINESCQGLDRLDSLKFNPRLNGDVLVSHAVTVDRGNYL